MSCPVEGFLSRTGLPSASSFGGYYGQECLSRPCLLVMYKRRLRSCCLHVFKTKPKCKMKAGEGSRTGSAPALKVTATQIRVPSTHMIVKTVAAGNTFHRTPQHVRLPQVARLTKLTIESRRHLPLSLTLFLVHSQYTKGSET